MENHKLKTTMKFLVLMWAIFLIFVITSSDLDTETYNLINSTNLAKPGCETRCGDLIVPYPFGIGNNTNCSISKEFNIYCNKSFNPPKASFYGKRSTWIKRISDSTYRTTNIVYKSCCLANGFSSSNEGFWSHKSRIKSFSNVNKFTVIGCDGYAWLTSATNNRTVSTGCIVYCSKPEDLVGDDECSGNGCCQSSIPQDIYNFTFRITTVNRVNSSDRLIAPCTYAFIGEENVFKFNGAIDLPANGENDTSFIDRIQSSVPVVHDWGINADLTCTEAEATNDYACQSNSVCVNAKSESGGYRCECKQGYQGNPYLSPGCQDINECSDMERFPCYGTCVNTIGNYACTCKGGFSGDAKVKDGCRRKPSTVLHLSLGLGLGFFTLLIGSLVLYLTVKQKKLLKQREKQLKIRESCFEQNGGRLLEEKLQTTGRSVMKIFQVEELEQATNSYAKGNILGEGGTGIVYKGSLPDTRVVAIKKSHKVNPGQRDQFINEIVILAQINHPNVVQLLGCCLENDVPLLVYEFVPNDTLHRHIHNKISEKGKLSWDSRLRIAHESAGALAYLHTRSRMSIIHRDVKSTNILLDDNYAAKIADFGASRLVSFGDDQLTTFIQGTIGYLDPEYTHTCHLTDKSDVYSFGVVLAELLTGKKHIDAERGLDDINLAMYFVKAAKENQLHDILDDQVVKEATNEQLKAASDLVCRCLNQVGEKRPSMKDVAKELESLRKSGNRISQENDTEAISSLMIQSEDCDVPLIVPNSGEHS